MNATRELEDLYAAARRASCRVSASSADGAHAVALIECPDGWAAARMLTALAESDADRPDVQQIALMLRVAAPDDDGFARAVHAFVKANVAFVREKGEVFTGPAVTLGAGFGDCDDHARLVYAVAKAGGIPARMALLSKPHASGPSHAVAQLGPGGMWWWAETTVDALFGEQPYDAARRLGLLGERPDIATEVTTMSEKDLPPMPKALVSSADQIARDAKALEVLGYICSADGIERADDEAFRRALADFQEKRGGLTIDGLPGPKTRAALADALMKAGAPGELVAGYMAGIGETAIKHSRHLSTEFFQNGEAMAARMREKGADVNAIDFYNAWLSESGIGRAKHGHGGLDYHGVNMMMGSNLPGLGWTGSSYSFGEADPADQIPIIERFYAQMVKAFLGGDWSKLNSATAIYLMNFLPAYTKHADDPGFVLARKGEKNGWWRDNPLFDAGRPDAKGWIEVSDLTKQLERVQEENAGYWAEVVRRAQLEGGTAPPSGVSKVAGLVVGGLVVLIAAGVFASVLTHAGDRQAVRSELRTRARDVLNAPSRALAAVRR